MSADEWVDCPNCEKKECVRVDFVYDYTLQKGGSIKHDIQGRCQECNELFKV